MWLILMTKRNNEYIIEEAGFNLVPQKEYDKVIITTERIAKQIDKVYFDGEKLNIKENEKLLSIDELNQLMKTSNVPPHDNQVEEPTIFDVD